MRIGIAYLRVFLVVLFVGGTGLLAGWMQTALAQERGKQQAAQPAQVWSLSVRGAIGPASSDLIVRTLEDAAGAAADLLVIELDTPGGLDKSMRDIIQAILASPVPVATYVHPQGARAASAGTYILYASHIAAMTPATNLGSATPVEIGGPQQPRQPAPDSPDSQSPPQPNSSDPQPEASPAEPAQEPGLTPMERKQINDAVAYIRGLAELRGRNADWAEAAVRQAANVSAREALELGVIDVVASDLEDLLRQLEGRNVRVEGGERLLKLHPFEIRQVEADWRNRFLAVITDPSIAYILLLIGIYGLILEFYNPGMGAPGILGGICLLLGLYALQMLPISYVGLGLILLGLGLLIAEAFSPSFGILGLGGVVSFVIGSILLMDRSLPAFRIAWPVILGATIVSVLVLAVVLHLIWKARRQKVVSGIEAMVGSLAEALEDFQGRGRVLAQGEVWQAQSTEPVRKGEKVRIRAVEGLTVHVEADS